MSLVSLQRLYKIMLPILLSRVSVPVAPLRQSVRAVTALEVRRFTTAPVARWPASAAAASGTKRSTKTSGAASKGAGTKTAKKSEKKTSAKSQSKAGAKVESKRKPKKEKGKPWEARDPVSGKLRACSCVARGY